MTFTTTRFNVGRILAHIVSLGLTLLGFCILLGLSAPVYIEPQFENSAQMLMGFGLLCLMGGCRIGLSLSPVDAANRDVRIIKLLLALIVAGAVYMIAAGAWGNFMA